MQTETRMTSWTKKYQDDTTNRIYEALKAKFPGLPDAVQDVVYKRHPHSISVRIIDPVFRNKDILEREALALAALEPLGPEIDMQIHTLLLYAPEEAADELNNAEFERPGRTGLLPIKNHKPKLKLAKS